MLDEWRRFSEAHANLGAWRYSAGNCNQQIATYLHLLSTNVYQETQQIG